MSIKNARTLGIRLDSILDQRLTRFEQATSIEGVSLCRAALIAALNEFEAKGKLSIPLRIIEADQTLQFPVKPDLQNRLNENSPEYGGTKQA